jgi:hypothetical protein
MAEYLCDPGDEAEVQAGTLCPALLVAGACHQTQANYYRRSSTVIFFFLVLGLAIVILIFLFQVLLFLSSSLVLGLVISRSC